MAHESGKHHSVLDTLDLVRGKRQAQMEAVQSLRDQLADAEGKLSRLDALHESLTQFLPDLDGIAGSLSDDADETGLGEAEAPHDVQEPPQPEGHEGQAALDVDGSLPLQEMLVSILATSDKPMRVGDLVDVIAQLRAAGHTDRLKDSSRPDSVVGSALDRLMKKGLVTKADRGLYTVTRADSRTEAA